MVQKKSFIRMIMILCLLATGGGSARAYDYTYMYDTSYPANNPVITLRTYKYVKTLGFGDWFSDYDYLVSQILCGRTGNVLVCQSVYSDILQHPL